MLLLLWSALRKLAHHDHVQKVAQHCSTNDTSNDDRRGLRRRTSACPEHAIIKSLDAHPYGRQHEEAH